MLGRDDWIATTSGPRDHRWRYHLRMTSTSGQAVDTGGSVACRSGLASSQLIAPSQSILQDFPVVQEKHAAPKQRRLLVETIRASARWRRGKADEFRDDEGARRQSLRADVALRALASFVEKLPDSDPDLNLSALSRTDEREGRLVLTTDASVLLSRFGLDARAWRSGAPTESQMRNMLRRIDGIEARERSARKRRAEEGYGDD
jgi:hypothetical protein